MEYDNAGIFHKDPKGLPGFLAAVHPNKPEYLEHLLKQVESERAMDIVQKVDRMFAMARLHYVANALVLQHVTACQNKWSDEIAPTIQRAIQAFAALPVVFSQEECYLCRRGKLLLPAPATLYHCVQCGRQIQDTMPASNAGNGEKAWCGLFLGDQHFAIMCYDCSLRKGNKESAENGKVRVLEGVTYYPNQLFRLPIEALYEAKEEDMVQCETCTRWEHVICTGALVPCAMDEERHHLCAACLGNNPLYRQLKDYGPYDDAYHPSNSPGAQTERAVWMTQWLGEHLAKQDVAPDYMVVEASRTIETLQMGTALRGLLERLGAQNSTAGINYRHTFLLLFHTGGGAAECCLVGGLTLHEYLTGLPKKVVYLAYLDSTNHVPPRSRGPAIQGFTAAAVASAALLGGLELRILAVTPADRSYYIMCERPEDMLLEPPAAQQPKLVNWYVYLHVNIYIYI
jgi:hypothetical protein